MGLAYDHMTSFDAKNSDMGCNIDEDSQSPLMIRRRNGTANQAKAKKDRARSIQACNRGNSSRPDQPLAGSAGIAVAPL
jgi:hypothetical protein